MIRSRYVLAAAAALTLISSPAAAQTFLGTTIDGPRWQRPLQGNPPAGLSGVGTNVAYNVFQFSVTAAGSYSFLSTATNPPGWDNFLFLYMLDFDPNNQLANVLIGNDDFMGTIGLAGFNYTLNTGVNYFLVTTGFANTDQGDFMNEIRGPGVAVPPDQVVPEPMTMLLLGTGLIGVAAARRRRRNRGDRSIV